MSRHEKADPNLLQELINIEGAYDLKVTDRVQKMRRALAAHQTNEMGFFFQIHFLYPACLDDQKWLARRRVLRVLLVDNLLTLNPNDLTFLTSNSLNLIDAVVHNFDVDIRATTIEKKQANSIGDLLSVVISELADNNPELLDDMLGQFKRVLDNSKISKNTRTYLALILINAINLIVPRHGLSKSEQLSKYQQMYDVLKSFSSGLGIAIHQLNLNELNENFQQLGVVRYRDFDGTRVAPVRIESILLQILAYAFNDVVSFSDFNPDHSAVYPLLNRILSDQRGYYQLDRIDCMHLVLVCKYPFLDRDLYGRIVFAIFNNGPNFSMKELKKMMLTILDRNSLSRSLDKVNELSRYIAENAFLRDQFGVDQIQKTTHYIQAVSDYHPQNYWSFSPMTITLLFSASGILVAFMLSDKLPLSTEVNLVLGGVSGLFVGLFSKIKNSRFNEERKQQVLDMCPSRMRAV